MLSTLNIIGGISAMAIGFAMVFFAVPRDGVSPKFLEVESVATTYVITSLGLIVLGLAWIVSYSAAAFSS